MIACIVGYWRNLSCLTGPPCVAGSAGTVVTPLIETLPESQYIKKFSRNYISRSCNPNHAPCDLEKNSGARMVFRGAASANWAYSKPMIFITERELFRCYWWTTESSSRCVALHVSVTYNRSLAANARGTDLSLVTMRILKQKCEMIIGSRHQNHSA